jgi:hypothetical protein
MFPCRSSTLGCVAAAVGILTVLTVPTERAIAEPAELSRPVVIPLVQEWAVGLPPHHVQGLAVSERTYWISTVNRRERQGWVFRLDRDSRKIVASRDLTDGSRYHPGGIQEAAGALWVPVAEYRSRSSTTVLKLDPTTFETLSSFEWDDHFGAIASDAKGTLYAANWDARVIYLFDETGKLKERRDNPTGVAYQDIDYYDGLLFCCGQATIDGKRVAVVDALDPATFELKVRYALQGGEDAGERNFAREGFAKFGEDFFVLPEDGPQSAIYRFGLPAQ